MVKEATRKKRTFKIEIVAESDLDDEQLTEVLMKAAHELTSRAEGRLIVCAGVLGKMDAATFWAATKIPEKPAPDATVIWSPK